MRLSFDLELGPLRIIFDPFPHPSPSDGIQADAYLERGGQAPGPELHKDHRDPFTDPGGRWTEDTRRIGFRP